jgi:PAS domain S-box-containing protein
VSPTSSHRLLGLLELALRGRETRGVPRYALAVVCAAAGLALRKALDPVWGSQLPFITSFPAVALAAWIGGTGPGLFAATLCALAAAVLWPAPQVPLAFAHGHLWTGIAAFIAMAGLLALLIGAVRRHQRRIAELAQTLRTVEHAEVRLAAIVQSSDDAIIAKDRNGVIQSWNPAAERMFGYTAAEAIGRHITLIVPPERHAEEAQVIGRILRGETVDHFETVRVRKDGRRLDISLTVSPIRDHQGFITGGSKICRDVTDRRRDDAWMTVLARAGEALSSSLDHETTLKQVAWLAVPEMASGCVVDLFDEHGVLQRAAVAHANPAAAELIWALPHRMQRPPDHPLLRAARGGEPVLYEEVTDAMRRALAPDAAYAERVLGPEWVESLIIVQLPHRNGPLGAMTLGIGAGRRYGPRDLGFAQDLARRASQAIENARLYGEVETANRRKDEFLAVLSHELRTPLNSVVGWTHLLREGRVEPEAVPRALEVIARNAQAQVKLVEDLLDVSRIVTGKMRLDMQPMHPITVIETVIESLRPAAEAKEIRLEDALDPRAGPIAGDSERLRQVVWNLLSNAVKFTPRGGRVQVRLAQVDAAVAIVVTDTGQGISPELLPRVFEHFRQGDSGTTRAHGGLGLGLALVKYLVELHGGSVQAQSPGAGQGATFTVTLPLLVRPASDRLAPGAGARGLAVAEAAGRLAGAQVLVVDDEPDALELARRLLQHEGAQVRTASSSPEALRMLSGPWRPTVLVADIEMPDEDGYQLMRAVRSLGSEVAAVPAVAVTAYGSAADRIQAISAGYQMHVAKPFEPAELIAAVASLARRAAR